MRLFNPEYGADIQTSSFAFLKNSVIDVPDVQGNAILKQWGFIQEVSPNFQIQVSVVREAPAETENVAKQPTAPKTAVKPVKKATNAKPAKKAVKVAKKIAKPTLSKKKVKSKK